MLKTSTVVASVDSNKSYRRQFGDFIAVQPQLFQTRQWTDSVRLQQPQSRLINE